MGEGPAALEESHSGNLWHCLLKGCIGYKSIHKIKAKSNWSIEHFKACLVGKGYTQDDKSMIWPTKGLLLLSQNDFSLNLFL